MQPTGLPVPVKMPPAAAPTSDEKTWALLAHLLNLAFPLLAPLVIYLVKKDTSKYVAFHALEATWLGVAGLVITMVTCGVGWVVMAIFAIIAAVKVGSGEYYEMPLAGKLARESVYGK
jgi:uncharacterized Tic20 family protein